MTERKVMSRADVFTFISTIGSATLAGKPVPTMDGMGDWMQTEDIADAMDAFTRSLASEFDKMPEEISDDIAVQETIRHTLDKTFAEITRQVHAVVDQMRQPKPD